MIDAPLNFTNNPLGFLGLGLLSRNLMLAAARQGFPVAGYDRDPGQAAVLRKQSGGLPVTVCATMAEFIGVLRPPRAILVLLQGGPHLEELFRELAILMNAGDLLIDGASYHHVVTPRRRRFFAGHGVHFLSAGIGSSGHCHQYGCRQLYPELQESCRRFRPLFESTAIAAAGEPCVTFVARQVAALLRRLELACFRLPPAETSGVPEGAAG